jgi:hypothetical protein
VVIAITSGTNNMGEVMQLVWDILLPAMQAGPLPANPQAISKLDQKTTGLKLKHVIGESSTIISNKIENRRFKITDNASGTKAIIFNLQSGESRITIEMEHGIESIAIGSDEYKKGTLTNHLPYSQNTMKKITASGAWTKPDEYQLRIYFYETPARIS